MAALADLKQDLEADISQMVLMKDLVMPSIPWNEKEVIRDRCEKWEGEEQGARRVTQKTDGFRRIFLFRIS